MTVLINSEKGKPDISQSCERGQHCSLERTDEHNPQQGYDGMEFPFPGAYDWMQ